MNAVVPARYLRDRTTGSSRPPLSDDDDEEEVVGVNRAAIDKQPDVVSVLEEIRRDFRMPFDGSNRMPDTEDDASKVKPDDHRMPKDLQEKFIVYRDVDADEILDTTHEDPPALRPRRTHERPIREDVNLNRGVSGVYDISELVAVLRFENAVDICAIEIPKELSYADYLVIASGRSTRHVKAIIEFVIKMHKRKKSLKDEFVKIQGRNSKDWMALDMGNIVLHVMLPDVRTRYDIESLWSVGEKYDRISQRREEPIMDALQKHLNFLQEMKPSSA